MKLFLGIGLCCLLAGNTIAQRGGMGGGFRGGMVGGPRGGIRGGFGGVRGGPRGRVGGFRNGIGTFGGGLSQPFGFGYVGGGLLDYGAAADAGESFAGPPYVSVNGPYIGIAGPYIGYSDGPYGPWPGDVENVTPDLEAPPAAPVQPYYRNPYARRNYSLDAPTYGAIARSSDDNDSRMLVWIALKDHFIDTAVAYWVEGTNLHYIKPDGSHNQISIGLVDRQISARLNAKGPGKLILP